MANKLGRQFDNWQRFEGSQIQALEAIAHSLTDTSKMMAGASDRMKLIGDAMKELSTNTGDHRRSLELLISAETKGAQAVDKRTKVLVAAIDSTVTKLKDLVTVVSKTSDRYAELSNRMIQSTGVSGVAVRDSRGEIVHGIVEELNRQTGGYFNPEKSYSKMLEIANQANIGSMEAIEELARPMLLATESMNVNQGQLATLLNKWYTRYNFSSQGMESMIDEIRGNTAGNNATSEATMRNLETVQSWMAYYAGGDSGKLEDWSKSLSKGTSWLESMNVDTSRYADYMKKIMTGEALTDTSMINLLGFAGLTGSDAQAMAASGQMEELMKALFDAETNLFSKVANDSSVKKQVSDVFGQDVDNLVDAYNARYNNSNYVDLEDFKQVTKNQKSSVETIDDMYVTFRDRLDTIISKLSESVAEMHFSDWASILSSMYTVLVIKGGLGKGLFSPGALANTITSAGGARGIGSALLNSSFGVNQWVNTTMAGEAMGLSGGAATAAGLAATAGGVLAGGALAWDGVKSLVDKGSDSTEKVWAGVEAAGGAAGIAGLVALGASNPVGWIALAVGGIGFLGKKAYENATALSGNAEKINKDLERTGESLKRENEDKLKNILEISQSYKEAKTLEDKKNVLLETGLWNEEEIAEKNESALNALVESYKNAAVNLDDTTDTIIKKLQDEYGEKADKEQKDSVRKINDATYSTNADGYRVDSANSNSQRVNSLQLLRDYGGIEDEKLLKKIDKALKDDKVTSSEWEDIMNGGNNSLFDSHHLGRQSVDTKALALVEELLGVDATKFSDSDNAESLAVYTNKLAGALTKKEWDAAYEELKNAGLEEELKSSSLWESLQTIKEMRGYRVGSNYIDSDQIASLHEGEAVIPKRYNPSANVTELEMLRKYYRDNSESETAELSKSIQQFSTLLLEIKEFLEYWKDDNNKRSAVQERLSRLSYNTRQVSQYKQV